MATWARGVAFSVPLKDPCLLSDVGGAQHELVGQVLADRVGEDASVLILERLPTGR